MGENRGPALPQGDSHCMSEADTEEQTKRVLKSTVRISTRVEEQTEGLAEYVDSTPAVDGLAAQRTAPPDGQLAAEVTKLTEELQQGFDSFMGKIKGFMGRGTDSEEGAGAFWSPRGHLMTGGVEGGAQRRTEVLQRPKHEVDGNRAGATRCTGSNAWHEQSAPPVMHAHGASLRSSQPRTSGLCHVKAVSCREA